MRSLSLTEITYLAIILYALLGCAAGTKDPGISNKGIRINIEVADEDGQLKGVTLNIRYANKKNFTKITNNDGQITLNDVRSFPIHINADNGKDYMPVDKIVTKDEVEFEREVRIILEKRKTILFGRVIDIESEEAVPKNLGAVTILTDPNVGIEQTDETGDFEIASPEIDEGVSINVTAKLDGKYLPNSKLVTIENYQGRNRVPTIGIKRLPGPTIVDTPDTLRMIREDTSKDPTVD